MTSITKDNGKNNGSMSILSKKHPNKTGSINMSYRKLNSNNP